MRLISTLLFILGAQYAFSTDYYVSTSGNDGSGNGSQGSPWRSLAFACSRVAANQGHTIILSAGTFVENRFVVPPGVSIRGAGANATIIKSNPSFYYYPATPGFGTDKFLMNLSSGSQTNGNQSLRDFAIDGDGKKLHGGIYVKSRSNVLIQGLKVTNTNFTGIWLWDVKDSRVTDVDFKDCAWGSSGWSAATLLFATLERVEIDHITVDENYGEGVKSLGTNNTPQGKIHYLKFHDNRISVNPSGQWLTPSGAAAPNIAFELWNSELIGCEMYNNYIDNTISLVMAAPKFAVATGVPTIRLYNNTFDLETRAKGGGYAIELTIHDAEIDHNYFLRGKWAIANWGQEVTSSNWNIHHNVFFGISQPNPGHVLISQHTGLHNVKFNNNTVEFVGTRTTNFVGVKGGSSENVELKNNLVINSNTSYSAYPNKFINLENGVTIKNLVVTNNLVYNMAIGNVPGTYANNLTSNPQITKSGTRPTAYYLPIAGSQLIDAGVNAGYPFQGGAPDIGAYEYGSAAPPPSNTLPQASITSPTNNSTHTAGSSITINATATDADGSVARVEFFRGNTKLGEDLTSPYTFTWNNVPPGNYSITAKATDNKSGSTTSSAINITVVDSNKPPVVSLTNPTDNAVFPTGSAVTLTANASDPDGSVTKVEFYNGSTKLSEDLSSPYAFAWNNVPSGNYTLTAKAIDNKNSVTTSASISITVSSGNNPPAVSITSPANNATFNEGAAITLVANASDTNGSITKVEFFHGGLKLGQDVTSPYSYVWTSATPGTYSITARATDNQNGVTTSKVITIVVSPPAIPPTVTLTSPKSNASFSLGTNITLTANASDPDGSVAKVEFYNGTTKLGEDLTAPYSFEWVNAPVGTHSLGARAIDSKNLVGNSSLTKITVVVSNSPPTVNLTGPANNSIFPTNSSISITATASDTDGSVAKVEFFNGATKLGEDVTSPYSFTWTTVPDGNYTISARATDNKGSSAISGSRNIIVNAAANPPTVNITTPTPNETFFGNSDITITASASTSVGTITKVEFFNGNTKIGEDATSPYSFTWPSVPAGNYSITARVTNSQNATNTSAVVNIILVLITTDPPQVNLTSPAGGSVFTAGSPITISATASEPNGTIERVEFFAGNTKIGEDLTSPYTLVWNNPPEGTFLLSATATGNSGATATDEIQIFVNAQNGVPTANAGPDISIQLPVTSLIIQGSGADSDGVISSYEWSQVSGPEEATFEQNTFGELVLGALVQGIYIFELSVTDNGNSVGKDQVTVNVTPSLLTLEQIPRYFSPNNDGINDLWEWPSVDLYEGAVVIVFNRFGQKVYEATSYQNDWDGTNKGKPLQDDAYYYVIKLLNTEIKGAVRIVR